MAIPTPVPPEPAAPAATGGTQPGTQPAPTGGTQPGTQPIPTSGTQPGAQPAATGGTQPGTQSGGTQSGTQSGGTQPGTQSAPTGGTQPGTQPSPSRGTQPGTQSSPSRGTQPGTQSGLYSGRTGETVIAPPPAPGSTHAGIYSGRTGETVIAAPPAPPSGTQAGTRPVRTGETVIAAPPVPGSTQSGLQPAPIDLVAEPQTMPRPPASSPPALPTPPRVTLSGATPARSSGAPDSLVSRGWGSLDGLMAGESQDDPSGPPTGYPPVTTNPPTTSTPTSTPTIDPVHAASDSSVDLGPDLDADLGPDPDADEDEPDLNADERDEDEDERETGTPTSFDRDERPLPDPDEVLISMTPSLQPPRRAAPASDSGDDSTRVESSPSGEIDGPGSGSGSLQPRRDALFGQVLADRYRVLDLIGKGGMGKVYLAEHVALGKRVAVKVLNQAYTHRPDQVKRFLREAQAASKIGHENVIDVIDFGEMPNGSVFFAMEHLQGEDLGKLLRRSGALPWSRARRILLQICRALQAAHAKGILHRDMKPENCFIIHRNGMRDFVKVLDFGIAKVLEENRQVNHTLTQAGALIGTPEYMAPEQVQGEVGDVRMDIYALGCIMYQLLTGQLPFSDKTMFGVLSQQVNVRPVPPRQLAPDADIPVEVEAIILKAMEKDRALRFQSMAELIEGIVAAPRGTADGRAGTTSNLDAAASAARIAAAMNAASMQALAGSNPATPQDVSLQNMTGPLASAAMQASTASAGHWPGVARDPQMLTKLVIGLGAAVLVLLIGLVCALNRTPDEPATLPSTVVVDEPTPAEPTKTVEPPVTPPNTPPNTPTNTSPTTPPNTPATTSPNKAIVPTPPVTPDPVEPGPPDIVVDDEPGKNPGTNPGTKDPAVKKPIKPKGEVKPKEVLPEPTLERLEPFDQRRALAGTTKDVETCRSGSSAPRGSVAIIKFKVDGATGRVLEATPTDPTPAARCIAKVVKAKVKFPRFKKTPQEFSFRFQM